MCLVLGDIFMSLFRKITDHTMINDRGGPMRPKISDLPAWEAHLRTAYNAAFPDQNSTLKSPRGSGPYRPAKQAQNLFKVELYRFYRKVKPKHVAAVRLHIEQRDGTLWNGRGDRTEQWVGRFAIAQRDKKTDQRRLRIRQEIALAYRNDIAPKYLLAFLYEVGAAPLISRAEKLQKRFEWAEKYRRETSRGNLRDTWDP